VGLIVDLTVEVAVESALRQTRTALGPIAILVTNAGMPSQARPVLGDSLRDAESGTILDTAPDAWRQALTRNLDTAHLTIRAALPDMVSAGWGRVVMVASVTGPVTATPAEAVYAASKAAMVGLMRAVVLDHAGDGVTCNALPRAGSLPTAKAPTRPDRLTAPPVVVLAVLMRWPQRSPHCAYPAPATPPSSS
jgi:3-oxoacyl-[acyl-carrier protein] reductase